MHGQPHIRVTSACFIQFLAQAQNFPTSPKAVSSAMGPNQPHTHWVPGSLLVGQTQGCEADDLLLSSSEDRNAGATPPLSHIPAEI